VKFVFHLGKQLEVQTGDARWHTQSYGRVIIEGY